MQNDPRSKDNIFTRIKKTMFSERFIRRFKKEKRETIKTGGFIMRIQKEIETGGWEKEED